MTRLIRFFFQPWFWFVAYACWFMLLFFLSGQSSVGPKIDTFKHSDKVLHAIYFTNGTAALVMGLMLLRPGMERRRLFLIGVVASLLIGAFDEWHQTFTPGRSGNDLGDLAADVVGGVLGFFVVLWFLGFAKRRGVFAKLGI